MVRHTEHSVFTDLSCGRSPGFTGHRSDCAHPHIRVAHGVDDRDIPRGAATRVPRQDRQTVWAFAVVTRHVLDRVVLSYPVFQHARVSERHNYQVNDKAVSLYAATAVLA